jgi:hypothetical protein
MNKDVFTIRIELTGQPAEDMRKMKEFYQEPAPRILYADLLFIIKKHIERIDTPPDIALKKK